MPTRILDTTWVNHGYLQRQFESANLDGELWSWIPSPTSGAPTGICLALPRWVPFASPGRTALLGVICQGYDSSKVCFWDTRRPHELDRTYAGNTGYLLDSNDFVGGAELDTNFVPPATQALECTDCHAGANAFVVHPTDAPFRSIDSNSVLKRLMPTSTGWYEPIVPSNWNMNQRKERRFAGTPSTNSCLTCHSAGSRRELPEMSQFGTPNYCNTVFRKATQWSSLTTMPDPSPASVVDPMAHATYLGHINAGDMWCNQQAPTNNGIEVNIEVGADDVTHVSPPVVREPVFTCGRGVAVGGFVPGAKLSLQIDRPGGGSYSLSASSGEEDSLVNFDLPQPLEEFDQLTAIQEFGGVASALSQSVIVRDHPGTALPPPTFDGPEIYACADSLSVRATPGSEITVEKNATAPMSTSPGDGWALIRRVLSRPVGDTVATG